MFSKTIFCSALPLFLLLNTTLYSQHTWEWLNPMPQGNILNDCAVIHDSTIIIVGMSGTIFISFDYGKKWNDYYSSIGNGVNLNSVSFYDNDNGIVVGGFIITTTDGGKTWSEKQSTPDLLDVDYVAKDYAYASGYQGRIIKSENNGINWTELTTNTTKDLYGISFINRDTGVVVGDSGTILKTTDGGASWINISLTEPEMLRSIVMVTKDKILAGGERGALYKSTNGGINWNKVEGSIIQILSYSDICVVDSNTFLVSGGYSFTGSYCSVIKTTDGGENWSVAYENIHPFFLTGISAYNEKIVTVGFEGEIFASDNRGNSWERLSKGNTSVAVDLEILDSLNFIALNRYTSSLIYRTTDGGENWSEYIIPTIQPMNSISFGDHKNGVVAGAWGNVFKTADSGKTWIKIDISSVTDTTIYLNSVVVIDSLSYFIVGDGGLVLKTTDGGNSWVKRIISGNNLYDVSFADQHGFAAGGTEVFYTSDNGNTWHEGINSNNDELLGVSAVDVNYAYAAGDLGIVLKTTDGGISWDMKPTFSNQRLESISFFSRDIGVAVGDFGKIYLTSDGGDLWIDLSGRTLNQLYSVKIINGRTAVMAGSSGSIIKMKFDIPLSAEEEYPGIPGDFALKQNYPNPFNPITKIKYSIPKFSIISLTIYDILSNKIETLINEEKPAGKYEVNWNAKNYPSGVYFYQLKAADFIETRKMLLMK